MALQRVSVACAAELVGSGEDGQSRAGWILPGRVLCLILRDKRKNLREFASGTVRCQVTRYLVNLRFSPCDTRASSRPLRLSPNFKACYHKVRITRYTGHSEEIRAIEVSSGRHKED